MLTNCILLVIHMYGAICLKRAVLLFQKDIYFCYSLNLSHVRTNSIAKSKITAAQHRLYHIHYHCTMRLHDANAFCVECTSDDFCIIIIIIIRLLHRFDLF